MGLFCPQCQSSNTLRDGPAASMEKYVCGACGHAFYVHSNYAIILPRAVVYDGYYRLGALPAAKAFILLKQILAHCQHFRVSQLEMQWLNGDKIWQLGAFNEAEKASAALAAQAKGLELEFIRSAAE
jgi:hypothetical protein